MCKLVEFNILGVLLTGYADFEFLLFVVYCVDSI